MAVSLGSIFKFVWRGWVVGVTAVFLPLFILAALLNPEAPENMVYGIPLIPVIAAFQGAIVGSLVVLGLKIWPPKELS